MKSQSRAVAAFLLMTVAAIGGCTHPPAPTEPTPADGNFPPEVANIFLTRCATAGCHNAASYEGAGGLRMDDWQYLFDGSRSSATVVPFSTEQSPLLFYINTDATKGPIAVPRMPLNGAPLSADEYESIRAWIAAGAPDKNGNIPFATDAPKRRKIYITQQGCDLVAVVDAATRQIMRQIPIGKSAAIESAHCIRVDEAGDFAYVSFLGGVYLQKIDCRTDQVVSDGFVGSGQWNILHVSHDGTKLMAADFNNGVLKIFRTSDMVLLQTIDAGGQFANPHGIAAVPSFDTFYITSQYGNTIYKFSTDGGLFEQIAIDGSGAPQTTPFTEDPHEIMLTPDGTRLIITCQASNKVRVLSAQSGALLATFDVGIRPQEIALSRRQPLAFVSCQEDASPYARFKGSVYVLNYETLQVVRRIDGQFYQPHGLAVNDDDNTLYVASSNADTSGIAPHHVSSCAGRNGWYNVLPIDGPMPATLDRYEMAVYPYSADTRIKKLTPPL